MPCIERQALVPYSPQSMFDLVASVERYPQFLPCGALQHISSRAGTMAWTQAFRCDSKVFSKAFQRATTMMRRG